MFHLYIYAALKAAAGQLIFLKAKRQKCWLTQARVLLSDLLIL